MAKFVTLAVTGSRPDKLKGGYDNNSEDNRRMVEFFKKTIIDTLALNENVRCISGGALGADTLWAIACLELRDSYKDRLFLEIAIPFENQDIKWKTESIIIYRELRRLADSVVNTTQQQDYLLRYMQDRNIYMVNQCDGLIAIYNGTKGGTHNCITYAQSKNKHILINDSFHK